jgi:hypothetical protein
MALDSTLLTSLCQAQRCGLAVVHVHAQLGGVFQVGGAHRRQQRAGPHLAEHLIARRQQGRVAHRIHVLA